MDGTREWFVSQFKTIVDGWYRSLRATSSSGAVWESPRGIRCENFISRSGRQVDGVTRMLPAMAAWAALEENREPLAMDGRQAFSPREWIRQALVCGTDPDHPDFWGYPPTHRTNQRQVEASAVAWTLWLSRGWLFEMLTAEQVRHLQEWLAACAAFTDLPSNWSLFVAVNHAARIALADRGFSGDEAELARQLRWSDEVVLPGGWLWDRKYRGIDYYNFWVYSLHHCWVRAMLPDYQNASLERSLAHMEERLSDLPYLIDARGRNVLFGRSLSYRWAWLSGLVAAEEIGRSPLDPGLSRTMLARNIAAWMADGSLDEDGVLRERLTADGSDGARSGYINCGHPYWAMTAFQCLMWPARHRFWTAPTRPLPIERGDFRRAKNGPGFVFQGIGTSGEVRLFNFRNLNHPPSALYEKFVYSTAFPCNAVAGDQQTLWDTQFGLRLPDGTQISPAEVTDLNVGDGKVVRLRWWFVAPTFTADVATRLTVESAGYTTEHTVTVTGDVPAGTQWLEGGFTLGLTRGETATTHLGNLKGDARDSAERRAISTKALVGWTGIVLFDSRRPETSLNVSDPSKISHPNILYADACHFVLCAPVLSGQAFYRATHSAT